MATENRDFKGVWIPRAVWLDERLNIVEKYYLSIYNQCGGVERVTDVLMQQIASKSTIHSAKTKLKFLGLVAVIKDSEEAKRLVLQRKGEGFACEWCGVKTYALQAHHFPTPKHKGGKETVMICPNCHYEYHAILDMEDE